MDSWCPNECEAEVRNRKPNSVSKEANASGSSKVNSPLGRSQYSSSSALCSTSMDIDPDLAKPMMAKASKDFEAEPFVRAFWSQKQEPVPVAHPQGPTTESNEPSASKDARKENELVLPVSMQLDYDWLRTLHRQSVNALSSSGQLEKEFMNLWNDFMLCPERMPRHAVKDPYKSLRQFVVENRQTIIDRSLGVSLLTHSSVFRDLGQITSAQWREVMFTIFTNGKLD